MNPNAPSFHPSQRNDASAASTYSMEQQQQQPHADYYSQPSYHHTQHQQPAMAGSFFPYGQPYMQCAPMPPGIMAAGPPPPSHLGIMTTAAAVSMGPPGVSAAPSSMMLGEGCGDETINEQQQQQGLPLSNQLLLRLYNHVNCAAIVEVQVGLEKLVVDGHDFELWANAVRDRLTGPDISGDDITLAVDLMIEMAVYTNNCQYNMSRLCQFLDQHIRSFAMGVLVPQLNEFAINHQEDYDYLAAEHRQNFLLFVAELYEKIEVNGIRLTLLSSLVLDQLTVLLKSDACDASVKAAVKVMKLIGRLLESDHSATPVNAVFGLLDDVCNNAGDVSDSVKGQVLALHQLRENKWGISTANEPPPTSTALNGIGPAGSSSMFIFGPDGKPLSEEEYAFLEEHSAPFGSNSPNESFVDEALDEDSVLADLADYEKFLEATAIRAAEKALEKLSFDEEDLDSIVSGASGSDTIRTQLQPPVSSSTQSQSQQPQRQYQPPSARNGSAGGAPATLTIVRKERRT